MNSARMLRPLKPHPVSDEVITQILDAAMSARSGGNSEHWAFVVVRSPHVPRKLGLIYRKAPTSRRRSTKCADRPARGPTRGTNL